MIKLQHDISIVTMSNGSLVKIDGEIEKWHLLIHIEGTVSQIFLICPSFCFMKSRKRSCKNKLKVSRFVL